MLSLLAAALLIFMPDIHVESDFMERGQPRYTQWKPGNRTECGDRYDRVVLRLVEKDFQSTSVAADNLIAADQHFVYERVPGENDSPEMKSLLAKISWKGNTWDIRENHLCRYHGRPTSNLIYRYPDHLDAIHDDSEAEIQSQTVETPEKFGHGKKELKRFLERFNFGR